MLKFEKKLFEYIDRNRIFLFVVVVSVIGLLARTRCLYFWSSDYRLFLKVWFEDIEAGGGFATLGEKMGDYSIAYQLVLTLLTYLPFDSLFSIKAVSIIFDYLLAWSAGRLAFRLTGDKPLYFAFGYAFVLLCPTVVMNSAMWGQCDSIFTFFCVFAMLKLYEKKDIAAFVSLGVALAFKLQTVFILPLFVIVYFVERRFSILYFLLSLGSFYVMCLPGVIAGQGLLSPFTTYLLQSSSYNFSSLNFPNLGMLFEGNSHPVTYAAVGITLIALGAVLMVLWGRKGILSDPKCFILVAAWTAWTPVMLLTEMHERYVYLADILLIILAVIMRKYIFFAICSVATGIATYGAYFYLRDTVEKYFAIFYVALWALFTALVAKNIGEFIKEYEEKHTAVLE